MREMKAGEERDRARFSATRLLEDLDEQWPSMKFLGFGAYYAWIFLSYNSDVLFGWSGASVGGNAMSVMYLASTTALGLVLIVAGAFQKVTARIVESRLSVTVLAGMATLATLVVAWSAPAQAGEALYVAGCSLTGVGTAFVALRLGSVYSTVGARQAFMYTAGSFIFAGMLYFVCIGLPQPVGLLMAASLPLLAVVFTMAAVRAPSEPAEDVVPVRELPRGYFIRLVVTVSVFSVIAGVIKGFMALQQPLSAATDQGVIIVFATACAAVLLFVLVGLLVREFDISQLYYPIIILTCLGNLVVPLFGGLGVIQGELVSIAYNLFILMVWCLLANVANRTDLSYVRVFGWGRGASAAGTTVGWFAGASLAPVLVENPSNMVALAMGMVFVLLVVSMVILNERTIGMALRKTRNAQTDQGTGDFFPSGRGPEGAGGASDGDGAPREGPGRKAATRWPSRRACRCASATCCSCWGRAIPSSTSQASWASRSTRRKATSATSTRRRACIPSRSCKASSRTGRSCAERSPSGVGRLPLVRPCGQSAKMPKFTLCVRDACGYNSADETGGDGCAVRRP